MATIFRNKTTLAVDLSSWLLRKRKNLATFGVVATIHNPNVKEALVYHTTQNKKEFKTLSTSLLAQGTTIVLALDDFSDTCNFALSHHNSALQMKVITVELPCEMGCVDLSNFVDGILDFTLPEGVVWTDSSKFDLAKKHYTTPNYWVADWVEIANF